MRALVLRWRIPVFAASLLVLFPVVLWPPTPKPFPWSFRHLPPGSLTPDPAQRPVAPATGPIQVPLIPEAFGAPQGLILWSRSGTPPPSVLERVRQEVGQDLHPRDFENPGLRTVINGSSSLDLQFLFAMNQWKIALTLQNQAGPRGYQPGVSAELFELPVSVAGQSFLWTSKLAYNSAGAQASMNVELPLDPNLWVWVEGAGTSVPSWQVRTGVHWAL